MRGAIRSRPGVLRRCVGLLVAGVTTGALCLPAGASTRPEALVVQGPAGTMADVVLDMRTVFALGDKSANATASTGGWAGVVVVAATGDPAKRASLVGVTMSEAFRCPGSSCPWSALGPPAMGRYDSGGEVVLPAGRYHVILAGAPGSTVTATLHPNGARGIAHAVRTTSRPAGYRATATGGTGPSGHEAQLHAYEQIPDGGVWSLAAGYATHAVAPAGAFAGVVCATTGSENATTRQVGGVAPCADLQGFDVLFGPWAGPTADRVPGTYAPVSAEAASIMGPSGDSFGVGWDESVVAPSSFLRSVFIGVSVT